MIPVADRLNGVGEYYFSQKLREIEGLNKTGERVINLGIGSPDLPPHPDVIAALHTESSNPAHHAYQSYRGVPALREAMAAWYLQWYNVQLDAGSEILPLMGSKEGIMHICMTFLGPGDTALVPNPGYPAYASAVQLAGAKAIAYPLSAANQFQPDIQQLEQLAQQHNRLKMLFINYPHMPTGELPNAAVLEQLIAFAHKHHILVVHDNPYSFILNNKPVSLLSVPGAKDVAVELNSLSKSLNMAGWRVGMLCGKAEYLEEVLRFKSNMDSGMFLPLQLAAARALSLPAEWYAELNSIYAARRKKVFTLLAALNCSWREEQAGLFVWAQVPETVTDGFTLSDRILSASRVFITPGGIFGSEGNRYIRISLCSTEAVMEQALERVKKITTDE